MTEKEKMLAGELYLASDEELSSERMRSRRLARFYNTTQEDEEELRQQILTGWFGKIGQTIHIEPPFQCDYGSNVIAGSNLYMNFDCIILDCNTVEFGDNVLVAPRVQFYTATHPVEPHLRLTGKELAHPIKIGHNVWIGGGAIIGPGVSIGDNSVIGAGSIVVKDIPANVVAVGNPCTVIRQL